MGAARIAEATPSLTCDEVDGVFQRLPLASGEHQIEIRAPGYSPLMFEVTLEPYQVINYKGELKRQ